MKQLSMASGRWGYNLKMQVETFGLKTLSPQNKAAQTSKSGVQGVVVALVQGRDLGHGGWSKFTFLWKPVD